MTAAHHGDISAAIWLYVAASAQAVTPTEVKRRLFPTAAQNAVAQRMRIMAATHKLASVGCSGRPLYAVTLGCEIPQRVTVREVLRGYGVGVETSGSSAIES